MEESHPREREVGCVVGAVPGGTSVKNRDKSRQRRLAVECLDIFSKKL